MHLNAQIHSLKSQLKSRPWVGPRLASLWVKQGQLNKAEKLLRSLLNSYPNYPSLRLELAQLYLYKDEKPAAFMELLKASTMSEGPTAALAEMRKLEEQESSDSQLLRDLLTEAWSRDRLSRSLRTAMSDADLLDEEQYRELFVPTEKERRLRDHEINRLIRRLVEGGQIKGLKLDQLPDPVSHADLEADSPAENSQDSGASTEPVVSQDTQKEQAPVELSTGTAAPRKIGSKSLARLYEQQGYPEKALAVLKALCADATGAEQTELKDWIERLERGH